MIGTMSDGLFHQAKTPTPPVLLIVFPLLPERPIRIEPQEPTLCGQLTERREHILDAALEHIPKNQSWLPEEFEFAWTMDAIEFRQIKGISIQTLSADIKNISRPYAARLKPIHFLIERAPVEQWAEEAKRSRHFPRDLSLVRIEFRAPKHAFEPAIYRFPESARIQVEKVPLTRRQRALLPDGKRQVTVFIPGLPSNWPFQSFARARLLSRMADALGLPPAPPS
ncbi:hypothetical protein HYV73_04955 [Candidatus Uhrbacteria bacterium]|nr:hypothetical protein [Candidatus Uhrbacteria bacterium]